ncbi:hypothetical protein OSG_eHP34_00205 [environmental Halophage eHP-34]|nr:hypothetical protein OSG_eHP34_00205 [environmental Halophage eHP-34]
MSDLEDFDPDGDSSTDHRLAGAEPEQQPEDAPRDDNDDPVLPDDSTTDTRHTVSESADKITVTTKVKRGEGTRDEDRIKVKVKGNDPDEVSDQLKQMLGNLRSTSEYLREMQPGENE